MDDDQHIDYSSAANVTDAVGTRRSIRAFLPTEVDLSVVKEILRKSARAPSGTNMQPWKAYLLSGQKKTDLCDAVCDVFDNEQGKHEGEVRYYPEKWFEPFISRRRKVGWDLYSLLGIQKGEKEKMHQQHKRNFEFFDAPVGLMFTIHRDLSTGSWLDYGMFLQNVMILAREEGLHTCPQAAWSDFHVAVRQVLPMDSSEIVVCGMAIGYADEDAIENSLVTEREKLEDFVIELS